MKFGELVSYTREFGKIKTDLLVVVPSLSSYGILVSHLGLLAKQTMQNFNLLLVLGVPFDDRRLQAYLEGRKFKFGIIIAKENARRGCSGGYFAGQKYSLENGYDYIIMGDDDCMPLDPGLIEGLYGSRDKKYVVPTIRFVADGYKKEGFTAAPYSYSLYSTEILREYGLTYLPLFHGADDAEYMERVPIKPFHIKNFAEHPYNLGGQRLFNFFDRSWLFLLHALIIIKDPLHTAYNFVQYCILSAIALFFLPPYGRRVFFITNSLLFTYTYGKPAHDKLKTGYQEYALELKGGELGGFLQVNDSDPSYIDSPLRRRLADSLKSALKSYRQNVAVFNTYSMFKAFLIAAMAKKVYVRLEDGGFLLLAENPNPFVQAAKLLLFFPFLAIYVIAGSLVFFPLKMLKQPRTMGYGLE